MHPTYIDLRAVPAAAALAPERPVPAGEDPFARHRHFVDLADPAIEIGWCTLAESSGSVESFGHHELMILLDGKISFEGNNLSATLRAGQSVVVPHGASFRWDVEDSARLVFMRYCSEEATEVSDLIVLDPDAPLTPSGSPLAALLLSETPSCRNNTHYATPTGAWSAGIWDSTPYHRAPMVYGHYEVMHILEGSVCLTDDQGRATTFGKDAIMLVPKGAKCSWLSEAHVRKVWGVLRTPS